MRCKILKIAPRSSWGRERVCLCRWAEGEKQIGSLSSSRWGFVGPACLWITFAFCPPERDGSSVFEYKRAQT